MLIMSNRKTPNFATQLFVNEKEHNICYMKFENEKIRITKG